ncbi:hypothetical protein SDC9_162579 [bioreactor metagenome]|uniref:Uncharacterized protein n=1 Tax=bioreactor metagenome TaxID=1076179 RepID=A0A645FPG2_9ZZZZ
MGKTVGNTHQTAIFIAFGIIDGLNASATWNIVFCCGDFYVTTVTHWSDVLYQSFAKGSFTYNDPAIEVLYRSGKNLRSRS